MTTAETDGVDEEKFDLGNGSTYVAPRATPLLGSSRFGLAIIGFLGFVNFYALRINMSVAMVCMIDQAALANLTASNNATSEAISSSDCDVLVSNSTSQSENGEFVWEKKTQGLILATFFWGYVVTHVPGGWLSERFGGKRIFGWFMFLAAVATLLVPVASRGSPYALMFLRFITGIGEGVVFPATTVLWSRWSPPLERSKLVGFTFAGAQIGNVVAMPLSALLCQYGFDGGWASIFYVFGIGGILWCGVWMLYVSDSPAQHRRINSEERKYIESRIGDLEERDRRRKELGTPWKKMFTSIPVLACIVATVCGNWATFTMQTNLPTYMSEILKFDIKTNGAFSALPYLLFWACVVVGGIVADKLRSRGVRTSRVRKILFALGSAVPSGFLVATGFITCAHQYVAVAVLTIAIGMLGFQFPGVHVNELDIAAPFAGTLFGIANSFGCIPGIVAPYMVGHITSDRTQEQWRVVFYITASICTFGAVFFAIFAQGETQEWVKPYMFEVVEPAVSLREMDEDKRIEKIKALDLRRFSLEI